MTDKMRVSRGDLAGLSVRAHDGLRESVAWLEGRDLVEHDRVLILTTARVTRTPSGGLIFEVEGTEARTDGM